MENFESLAVRRRSTRKFTDGRLSPEDTRRIFQAALLAPTSKNCKSWEFVAVEDKAALKRLAGCKDAGGAFLEECALAVVVLGDMLKTDAWVEDASIAAAYMQLQAEDLGIGSCWCQVRNRSKDGIPSENYVRDLLEIPGNFGVLCIIGFGHKGMERKPNDLSKLTWEKVHVGQFPPADRILMA